jgi:holo-[acyl-carrier protein] synthase
MGILMPGGGLGRGIQGNTKGAYNIIIGIGADILQISRMEKVLRRSPEFAERFFSVAERAYCRGKLASLAANFAAKEAALKALGCGWGKFPFHEIEIHHRESGKPEISLHGKAREYAAEVSVNNIYLSLSHSGGCALAFAVAVAQ